MKGLAKSSPFHLLTNPHVINRFIFGHGVVIYYMSNGLVSSKIYDKRDDFDFDIANFPFLWMVTFLAVLLIVYTFRNLLGLLESAIMLRTSTRENKFNGLFSPAGLSVS